MNGIHDLGGMTCFGAVEREHEEPVFHSDWERRVFAMGLASPVFFGPVDRVRHAIERMDPVAYLTTSYYEHWLASLEMLAKELGYVTDEEIAAGTTLMIKAMPHRPPDAETIERFVRAGAPATREAGTQTPRYRLDDEVRARNMEVRGHSRLPRYVRGKRGRVARFHGIHVFPDTVAHDAGERPQPLYSVRFDARELWGDNVDRNDCVYIDLWESYLEPVSRG